VVHVHPIRLTDDYRKNGLARNVPDAYFADGAWWLPPDPDPESARIALRFFPGLQATEPELVAASRLSVADHTPIDLATEWWGQQDAEDCLAWHRRADRVIRAAEQYHNVKGEHTPIVPHNFQIMDAAYATYRLRAGYGAYLGWEMGLGKTLGACLVMDMWDVNYVLIACPNNAKQDPWVHMLSQLCPWLGIVVVGNTRAEREAALAKARRRMDAGKPTAVICHYAALPIIESKHGPKTVSGWKPLGQFDLKIADEAHMLGNRKAQFTSALRRIPAVGMLDLSGSVMSGAPEKLFVPWQMFQPKRYKSQWRDWNDRFLDVVLDDYGQKQIVGPKLHRLPAFRAELGECLVVRKARDYLEIPAPHVVDRLVEMHPEQARVYREMADDLMSELPDGTINYATDGAPLRSALRQVTAGIPGGDAGLISAKHDAALEDIQSAGDSQIVMFAWHRRAVEEIARRCREAGIGCGVVSGAYSQAEREREIDLFKRGGYRVLAATIKTLSSAANLQNASVVGMLEESDDPIDNEQAIGRVVRQGQRANASVYLYRVPGSVDDLSVQANYLTKAELRSLILGS